MSGNLEWIRFRTATSQRFGAEGRISGSRRAAFPAIADAAAKGVGVLVLGWLCVTARAESQSPPPQLVCDEPVFSYGSVENTGEVRHTFVVRNAGASTISIERIHSGCGCTRAEISRQEIPAGETANLAVALSLQGRTGPRQVSVYVHSNDPVRPIMPFMLTGTALAPPATPPAAISLPPPNPVLPIHGPAAVTPSVSPRPAPGMPGAGPSPIAGVGAAMGGRTAPSAVRGPQPDAPPQPPIAVVPSELVLSAARPAPYVQFMIVRTPNGQAFHVTDIACNVTGLRAELARTEPAWNQIRITVDRTPLDAKGNAGLLTLSTDLPAAPCVEVPVRIEGGADGR